MFFLQVLMTLTKGEKGISGRMRIAAFLQSVDAGYFEAVHMVPMVWLMMVH